MVTVMKGLIPAPKGRVRTPVGHKYLEALQSKVNGDSDTSSSTSSCSSSSAHQTGPGLDLLILGLTSGTAMDDIDFALCRFTQESPEAPLCLEIVQVLFTVSCSLTMLMCASTIPLSYPPKFEPISSPCYEKMPLLRVCCPRWTLKWDIRLQMLYMSLRTSTESRWMRST